MIISAFRLLVARHPLCAIRHVRSWGKFKFSRHPMRLHLACGRQRFEGCVNIDMNYSSSVDYLCDIRCLPCRRNSVEQIESYHLIEHIPHPQVPAMLRDWHRILIPGGTVVLECPDLDKAVQEYIGGNSDRLYSIYGRQRFPGDTHYFGYNFERLKAIFEESGFVNCRVLPATDYHAETEPCLRFQCQKPVNASAEEKATSEH